MIEPGSHNRHVARFARAAAERDVPIEIRRFASTTRTAGDAAREIGCELGQIIKSLVFLVDGAPVLVLCAGTDRVDEAKLRAHLGARQVRRASADEARTATGYPVGGTPPFGHQHPLRTLIDPGLFRYQELWSGAGLPEAVARIRASDLARATRGEVADVVAAAP